MSNSQCQSQVNPARLEKTCSASLTSSADPCRSAQSLAGRHCRQAAAERGTKGRGEPLPAFEITQLLAGGRRRHCLPITAKLQARLHLRLAQRTPHLALQEGTGNPRDTDLCPQQLPRDCTAPLHPRRSQQGEDLPAFHPSVTEGAAAPSPPSLTSRLQN